MRGGRAFPLPGHAAAAAHAAHAAAAKHVLKPAPAPAAAHAAKGGAARAHAEELAEDVLRGPGGETACAAAAHAAAREAAKAASAKAAAAAGEAPAPTAWWGRAVLQALLPVNVVDLLLLGIRQDLVRLGHLLKLVGRGRVALVLVLKGEWNGMERG